jgi:uncharacterized protein YkwD
VRRTLSRIGTVVVVSLVASLVLGAVAAEAGAKSLRRDQMLELMNEKREARGIAPLDGSPRLRQYSRHHSVVMARRGYLFHTHNLANKLRGVQWSIAGENVGSGGDVDTLFKAFMDSAPHRKNILRKSFRHVGIGFVQRHGSLWVTMVFYG